MALELLLVGSLLLLTPPAEAALLPWPMGRGRALMSRMATTGRSSPSEPIEASLSAVELIHHWGYPAETHSIQTEDGYLLSVQRIPWGRRGRESGAGAGAQRPAAILQHGLLQSADQWLLRGPDKDLALIMADKGYDVWLGNFRGNTYSKRHAELSPNSDQFWNFSWHENGFFDLASFIDYVLAVTGQSSLFYIGHSMGTTALVVLLSTRPEYNSRVRAASLLAPVAYFTKPRGLLSAALPLYSNLETELRHVQLEILPRSSAFRSLSSGFCRRDVPTYNLCLGLYFLVSGVDEKQMNSTLFRIILAHLPSGASLGQFSHYSQVYKSGKLRLFDHGDKENLVLYGQPEPPLYDLQRVVAPLMFHYSSGDFLAQPQDVERLAAEIPGTAGLYKIKGFNHGDYMWANASYELLYDTLLNNLQQF